MKIVALTGAGISKSAGIPTFEEIKGLKSKLSVEFKDAHPNEFQEAIDLLKDNVKDKEPTKAHRVLAKMNIPIITMNVDGLHQKAGSKVVYELHGNYQKNNIVLYGQEILCKNEAINLILKTAIDAKNNNEEAILLVIGTSMQTTFPIYLTWLANERGMQVCYINQNADEEVLNFIVSKLSE